MRVNELMELLDAFKVAGYGGYEVLITYEQGCSGEIHEVTLDLERETLFIGE